MSHERSENYFHTQPFIESDLARGRHDTFDIVLEEVRKRSGEEENLFKLSGLFGPQIDITIHDQVIYRLSFYDIDKVDSRHKKLTVCMVDKNGDSINGIYTIENSNDETVLSGTYLNGQEATATSNDVAWYLNQALDGLRPGNWKLVS